jgi:cytochrome c oxidase subunit IV
MNGDHKSTTIILMYNGLCIIYAFLLTPMNCLDFIIILMFQNVHTSQAVLLPCSLLFSV